MSSKDAIRNYSNVVYKGSITFEGYPTVCSSVDPDDDSAIISKSYLNKSLSLVNSKIDNVPSYNYVDYCVSVNLCGEPHFKTMPHEEYKNLTEKDSCLIYLCPDAPSEIEDHNADFESHKDLLESVKVGIYNNVVHNSTFDVYKETSATTDSFGPVMYSGCIGNWDDWCGNCGPSAVMQGTFVKIIDHLMNNIYRLQMTIKTMGEYLSSDDASLGESFRNAIHEQVTVGSDTFSWYCEAAFNCNYSRFNNHVVSSVFPGTESGVSEASLLDEEDSGYCEV